MGGTIKPVKIIKTKKGDMIAFASLENMKASVEVVVFPNIYADTHQIIADEEPVILEGEVQKRENSVKLLAEKIIPMDQAKQEWTASIIMNMDLSKQLSSDNTLDKLKTIVDRYPGTCTSFINIIIPDGSLVVLELSEENSLSPDAALFKEVNSLLGPGSIETKCAAIKQKEKKKWYRKNNTMN